MGTSSTCSDTTIGDDQGSWGILSIPTELTLTGPNWQSEIERSSDPNRPPPGNSGGRISNEGSTSAAAAFENPWCTTSPRNEATPSSGEHDRPVTQSWPKYSRTETCPYMDPQQGIAYGMYAHKPRRSSKNWRMPSALSPLEEMIGYEEHKRPLKGFSYDEAMFGEGFVPSQNAEDFQGFHS